MITRKRIAALALIIGTLLSALWLYAEQLDDEHEALVADQVEVVKARRDVASGVPLTKDLLTTEKVPRKFLPPSPLLESELNIYLGTPLARSVSEGSIVLTTDFSYETMPKSDSTLGADGRMIVKTASLRLRSQNPVLVAGDYASFATKLGGYVEMSQTDNVLSGSARVELRVRVPANRFDTAMQNYRHGGQLEGETIDGRDVTDKFVDLSAQARNQRVIEEKLLTFVETAKSVDDAIALEEKIQRYRMEAEKLEGRARAVSSQEAMSTITIELRKTEDVGTKQVEPAGFFDPIVKAFAKSSKNLVEGFATALTILSTLLPFGLVFGPLCGFGYAIIRSRRR